jgi:hypothetical protein
MTVVSDAEGFHVFPRPVLILCLSQVPNPAAHIVSTQRIIISSIQYSRETIPLSSAKRAGSDQPLTFR